MKKIIVYSTPTCPYCTMAKDYLTDHQLAYEEKNVAVDQAAREEMMRKSGQIGVPVIDIDGQIIMGFDKERIAKLLNLE